MNGQWVRMSRAVFCVFALALLFALPARAQSDAANLYKAKCAACHGVDGKGDTVTGKKLGARDFASPEVQRETDQELIEITAKGKNKMPGYEKS